MCKEILYSLKDEGWDILSTQICKKNEIEFSIMVDVFVPLRKRRRNAKEDSVLHHDHVDIFRR